jgi:tetratricopeptide (TPR) repeat protein
MILYRPVGLRELELIYDSGMKAFPARLPEQPIFYPVLSLEYARQVASDWNVSTGQFAGYVTQFKMEDQYIGQFEEHSVGSSQHQELWIPADEVETFNRHIMGHIKVLDAYFGDAFQGSIPEKFALQGKNAVEQFTLLANSYLYTRMDFYLEIKRNHKAVFLNYPFWQTYQFKNPGLKEKIIKAIKEAWLTSFPQTPLPMPSPVHDDISSVRHTDSRAQARPLAEPVQEDITPVKPAVSRFFVNPLDEETTLAKPTDSQPFGEDVDEDILPVEQPNAPSHAQPWVELDPVDEDSSPEEQTGRRAVMDPVPEPGKPVVPARSHFFVNPVHREFTPVKQTTSHFSQGVELGLSGKFREAIDELSRAVAQNPQYVVAYTSLGVAFHGVSEDARALSCYEAALKIDPNYPEAHYFRANLLYSQGNVREAIAGYTIAIGLKPELIDAHQNPVPRDRLTDYSRTPAEMYLIAKPAHRILDLSQSLESNPRQANLLKERAAEYYRLWNYEQTIADYSSSLEIQPDDAGALHLRGVAYEQLRQFDRSIQDYKRAAALNPQLSDEYIQRGVTFGQTGNFRQSVASLSEGIRLAPRNPDGYFNRGTSYFQLGDFESAIQDFSMVIQLAENDEAAYYWRGISNEAAGHARQAIADYQQFLVLSQDPSAREEIEQRLSQWGAGKRDRGPRSAAIREDRHETNQIPDLYHLIVALGQRALGSTWFGSGVRCSGEKADELYAYTEHNTPIQGRDLIQIASGIHQTLQGDFQAYDPNATSHWLFIRAWDGEGFYLEIDDPKSKDRLKRHFQAMEEVEGAPPPYEGLFLHI